MQSALNQMATAIAAEPEIIGTNRDTATELAKQANSVTQSVKAAARSQGITITPADLWGDRVVVTRGEPVLLETPGGKMFGIGRGDRANLNFHNSAVGVHKEGDVLSFSVENETCQAFVSRVTVDQTTLSLRC